MMILRMFEVVYSVLLVSYDKNNQTAIALVYALMQWSVPFSTLNSQKKKAHI